MNVDEIITKYSVNKNHANQVEKYALWILDGLAALGYEFSVLEKKYLETAALLHDLGYYINSKSHHKHSFAMILDMDIDGFSQEEKEIIAHTARYHRSSLPDESKHESYALLNPHQKETVNKLAAILKIADGMDSPNKNVITGIKIESNDEFIFNIKTVGYLPKLKKADTKKDLFELVYKKPVKFVTHQV